jgi:hypothetical protein
MLAVPREARESSYLAFWANIFSTDIMGTELAESEMSQSEKATQLQSAYSRITRNKSQTLLNMVRHVQPNVAQSADRPCEWC